MKLIKLELQAFGPFKDYTVINFNEFQDNSLFLISGKTGSGKTTIFDAISYALFGETTGVYRKPDSLRSQYAKNEIDTYVALQFSSNNHTYEIKRSPSYMKEGRKTATIPISTLTDLTQNKLLGEKSKDVGAKIEAILGFNAIQFRQIVVLPQGEFIKILNSSSKDRAILLSSILNVSIYNEIQEQIKSDFNEIDKKVTGINNELNRILNDYNASNLEELNSILDNNISEFNEINSLKEENKTKYLEKNNNYLKAESNNKNLSLLLEAKNNLQKLKLEEDKFNSCKDEIDILTKIKEISPVLESYNKNSAYLSELKLKIEEINNKLLNENQNHLSIESINDSITQYSLEYNKLDKVNAELENYAKEYNKLIKNINENKNGYLNTNKIIEESKIKLNNINKEISKINDENLYYENDKKSFDYETLSKLKDIEKIIFNNIEVNSKIFAETKLVEKFNNDILFNKNELNGLNTFRKAQYELYKLGDLSKYVNLLKDNSPCPLCGSLNHPNIILCNNEVKEEDIEKIDSKIKDLQNKIVSLDRKLGIATSNIEVNKNQINKDYLDYSLEDLKKEIETEEEAKIRFDKINSLLEKNNLLMKKYIDEKHNLDVEISILSEKINNYNNNILRFIDRQKYILLEAKVMNFEDLENNILTNKSKLLDINSNKEAKEKLLERVRNLTNELSSNNLLVKKCNDDIIDSNNKLSSFKALNPNIIPSSFIEQLANKLNDLIAFKDNYNNLFSKYTGQIDSYKSLITNNCPVDLSILESELAQIKNEATIINDKFNNIFKNLTNIKNSIKRYNDLTSYSKDDIKKYEMLNELYLLTSGKTSGINKMNLESFVLAKILDDILVYTNNYLTRFTDRRYTLNRDDSLGASDRGLELSILDNYTGLARGVGSLSGGETFMTCLALALGTSEYISTKYGGISLGNIFVDEGFGSLDNESLNQAIETLMELACNGKMIGIISHVEELKQRINQIIEVKKTKFGSSLKVIL